MTTAVHVDPHGRTGGATRADQADVPSAVSPEFFADRRWSWRSGACAAIAHHFEVLSEAPELVPALATVMRPLRSRGAARSPAGRYAVVRRRSGHAPYALYYEGRRLLVSRSAEPVLRVLTWHVNQQAIHRSSEDHVVLHAAAATRAGLAVLLPGEQEHGKSTTVAGLLRRGFEYVTDEAAALLPDTGCIVPFPKAVTLDEGSWSLFPECRPAASIVRHRQWHVPAQSFGSKARADTVPPPKVIVFPHYVPGATTRLTGLTKAEAVQALAQATFEFERHPARNLTTLATVVRSAFVARLCIGNLEDAVEAIEHQVSEAILQELR